jgi:hypothetical protein
MLEVRYVLEGTVCAPPPAMVIVLQCAGLPRRSRRTAAHGSVGRRATPVTFAADERCPTCD